MKAILINPETRSITQVEYEGNLSSIYQFLDASLFDVVRINDVGDVLYVDDEGLYNSPYFFKLDGYPAPLAGNGLVLGTDMEGESVSPMYESVETLEDRVTFITRDQAISMAEQADAEAEKYGEKFGDNFIHISAADIIKDQVYTDPSDSE